MTKTKKVIKKLANKKVAKKRKPNPAFIAIHKRAKELHVKGNKYSIAIKKASEQLKKEGKI